MVATALLLVVLDAVAVVAAIVFNRVILNKFNNNSSRAQRWIEIALDNVRFYIFVHAINRP